MASPDKESEEAIARKKLTQRIYEVILPLLGPQEAQELLQIFNSRLGPKLRSNLQPVIDQRCEVCQSPMKIEENGDDLHYVTSCTPF